MNSESRIFHCRKGCLSDEDQLALLVWLFEVPPSKIIIEENKVTVPSTLESRFIYNAFCTTHESYKFSNKDVIGTNYGIMLRRFAMQYTVDHKGFQMLNNMSNGHPIEGMWNPVSRQWEFEEGLGYRNTGRTLPVSCSQFQMGRTGLGYKGENGKWDSLIKFVKSF
jgi:hypothetical protein